VHQPTGAAQVKLRFLQDDKIVELTREDGSTMQHRMSR
jgi:hypothetical protein